MEKRYVLLRITTFALILRLAAVVIVGRTSGTEVYEYSDIALNIVQGLGYSFDFYDSQPTVPTAWMAPFYTYFLAGCYALLGNNHWLILVLQGLLGVVTCWLIGLIGLRIGSAFTGIAALILFSLYPEAIFLPLRLVSESWLLLWMMLFVLWVVNFLQTSKKRYLILAGVAAGLAALTKESALVLPFLALIWIAIKRGITRKTISQALLLLIVTAVTVLPWTVRNYVIFQSFIPVRTGFWYNAWRGNHPGATGTARSFDGVNVDYSLSTAYRTEIEARLSGNEVQREKIYREFTLRYIAENPGQFLKLCAHRVIYFWIYDPTHPLTGHILYWLPWLLLLGLAILGSIAARERWRDYVFWYALFGVYTLSYGLTMVLPRYREPLLPGLMFLAAEGIRWSYLRVSNRPSTIAS
ncbi:MAG: glycosyltransferase family 39 protein [bacterium]